MQRSQSSWRFWQVALFCVSAVLFLTPLRPMRADEADKPKPVLTPLDDDDAKAEKPKTDAEKKAEQEAMLKAMQEQFAAEQRAVEKTLREDPAWQPTHVESGVIRAADASTLNTFCLNPAGNILAGCGDARKPELRTYNPGGELLETWKVDTTPQAVCVDAEGQIYLGGNGRLLKLDHTGKLLADAALPSLADDKAEDKKADDKQEGEKKAKKSSGSLLGALFGAVTGSSSGDAAQAEANSAAQQAYMEAARREVTGIAVTDKDLFIACHAKTGWGFSIWRVDRDFKNPKEIITGLSGCCGQMDVQAYDGDPWVPENARHRVSHYDRDGKLLASFGKFDRKAADGFGGCCEPKNLRFGPTGEIYAAESGEPVAIKRFTRDGKFLGVAAVPQYKTGCVRVCVEVSKDARQLFILSPGECAIHVLTDKRTTPTHEQRRRITVSGNDTDPVQLNSFCLAGDGNLLAACARPVVEKGDVRVVSPEGNLLNTWKLDFVPQAINLAPDGTIFVAGNGRVAQLSPGGKVLQMAEVPADKLSPPPEVKPESAEETKARNERVATVRAEVLKLSAELQKVTKELRTTIVDLAKATDDTQKEKLSAARKELEAKRRQLMEDMRKATLSAQQDMVAASQQSAALYASQRVKTITGIAASERDVFIVHAASQGFAYEVWRTDRKLGNAQKVVEGLRGCCGQMDVQAFKGDLWIPENTRHMVNHYDRDGKLLGSFGKFDRNAVDGFGGCCEPKNIRFAADGNILAAESGTPVIVKRFTPDGQFLGVVGIPKYTTGCVRVCVDVSRDGKQVFILSPGENAIYCLAQTENPAVVAAADKSNGDVKPAAVPCQEDAISK